MRWLVGKTSVNGIQLYVRENKIISAARYFEKKTGSDLYPV